MREEKRGVELAEDGNIGPAQAADPCLDMCALLFLSRWCMDAQIALDVGGLEHAAAAFRQTKPGVDDYKSFVEALSDAIRPRIPVDQAERQPTTPVRLSIHASVPREDPSSASRDPITANSN